MTKGTDFAGRPQDTFVNHAIKRNGKRCVTYSCSAISADKPHIDKTGMSVIICSVRWSVILNCHYLFPNTHCRNNYGRLWLFLEGATTFCSDDFEELWSGEEFHGGEDSWRDKIHHYNTGKEHWYIHVLVTGQMNQ